MLRVNVFFPLEHSTAGTSASHCLVTCEYVSDIGLYPRLCQLSNDVAVNNMKRRMRLILVYTCEKVVEREIFSVNILLLYLYVHGYFVFIFLFIIFLFI